METAKKRMEREWGENACRLKGAEQGGEVRHRLLSFGEIWGKGRGMWLLLREQQFRRNRSNTGRACKYAQGLVKETGRQSGVGRDEEKTKNRKRKMVLMVHG